MRDMPLPMELARPWGNNADIRYRGNNEWSSACPQCNPEGRGGHDPSDRFRMFSTGGPHRAWCRGCDFKSTAKRASGEPTTREESQLARAAYLKWLKEENNTLRDKVRWLQKQDFWQRWHRDMGADARSLWHGRGVSDSLIDMHQLGYTMDRYEECGGALTLPYIHQDEIQTLQLRLMIEPSTGDKYRFEQGTKAAWFYPYQHDVIGDVVLVAEGGIKSMVLWQTIAQSDAFTYRGVDITIIASPSKHIPHRLIDKLDDTKLVILMLDPDAYTRKGEDKLTAIERNAQVIGVDKCKHVRTVGKVDDMIMEHGLNAGWVQRIVDQASPIIMPDPSRKPTTRFL